MTLIKLTLLKQKPIMKQDLGDVDNETNVDYNQDNGQDNNQTNQEYTQPIYKDDIEK